MALPATTPDGRPPVGTLRAAGRPRRSVTPAARVGVASVVGAVPRGDTAAFRFNVADPLLRRTRTRPDHNRVRDAPSSVSVLGLAPPPPLAG